MLEPHRRSITSARQMRKALTPPEARLWTALRRRSLGGLRFRRQHPIGPFILDFYCETAKLAVEVDGILHDCDDTPARDARRDLWLERHGLTVLRVPASAVKDNLDGVLALIWQTAQYSGPPS
jgi:very-short-patch-repair endonuclease